MSKPHQKKAKKNNVKNLSKKSPETLEENFLPVQTEQNEAKVETKVELEKNPKNTETANQKVNKTENKMPKTELKNSGQKYGEGSYTSETSIENQENPFSKIEKKSSEKKSKFSKNINPNFYPNVMLTIFLVSMMGLAVLTNAYILPEVVLQNTDSAVAERAKKEADQKIAESRAKKTAKMEEENKILKFTDQKVAVEFENFGTLKFDLTDKASPKTVENFVRLAHRKYFDGTIIHRMVESPNFNVIQGGDPNGTGVGGETASGEPLVDEVWKVKPESDPKNPGKFLNTPEFTDPTLYKDFNIETGEVVYAKGQILMAKTAAPDSATSQFFITLTDTKLPAEYTIFGTLQPESIPTLEKISTEIDPISEAREGAPQDYKDGKPNKDLKIKTVSIL